MFSALRRREEDEEGWRPQAEAALLPDGSPEPHVSLCSLRRRASLVDFLAEVSRRTPVTF